MKYILSNFETLVKRDSKGIYSKKTPVVGKSIKFSRPKFSNFYITNTGSLKSFLSNSLMIDIDINKSKFKFYK